MKIDTMYCFYDDVLGEEFNPSQIHYEKTAKNRNIHNLPWLEQDPDAYSNKLYEYHQYLWGRYFEAVKTVYRRKNGKEILCLKSREKVFTSDYIGPSSYHANQAGISDEELGQYLKLIRTIGGHILWPVGPSVNVARGRSFCDRFDVTLFDLKRWYMGLECRLKKQWDSHKEWLIGFGSFVGFIRFHLLHSFVNQQYEVLDLTSKECLVLTDYPDNMIPKNLVAYKEYFDRSISVIEERNELIEEFADIEIDLISRYMECNTQCKCGSYNVSKVSYGLPGMTGRIMAKIGYIHNGGCVVQTHNTRYHCNDCKLEWERSDRKTPNGGKYSVMYISPKDSPVILGSATSRHCEIIEYDENDNMVASTIGVVDGE